MANKMTSSIKASTIIDSEVDLDDQPFRVLVADDHELLSHALADALKSYNIDSLTAKSFDEVVSTIREYSDLDMVLLDLQMPGMKGIESVMAVVKAAGNTKVVLFTGSIEKDFLQSALDANVWGLIPKTISLRSMINVIKLIATGEVFLPFSASTSIIIPAEKKDIGSLSKDEFAVIKGAAEGLTNKEIAFNIGSSEARIKMLMRSVCNKFDAKNRAHAVALCRDIGIV